MPSRCPACAFEGGCCTPRSCSGRCRTSRSLACRQSWPRLSGPIAKEDCRFVILFSFISYDTPTFIVPILDERVQYFVVCQNSGLAAVLSLFSCMEINGGRSRLRLWLVECCLGLPVSRASRARCVDWSHSCSAVKVILSLFRAALNHENLEGCM